MSFLTYQFISDTLGLAVTANVILPNGYKAGDGTKTLYLLHGLSDDHTAWCRYTSIERYAREKNIAVVMPAADRSFYMNGPRGDYWTYISEELPRVIRNTFGLSDKREDNFVAGLSMGGYGAMRHALLLPDRYFAAGSFSGAFCVEYFMGKDVKNTNDDVMYLLKKNFRNGVKLPRLYQHIGKKDSLYDVNQRFRDLLKDLRIPSKYVEDEGDHSWKYWDEQVKCFIDWALSE